jgi:hypothetical protein
VVPLYFEARSDSKNLAADYADFTDFSLGPRRHRPNLDIFKSVSSAESADAQFLLPDYAAFTA